MWTLLFLIGFLSQTFADEIDDSQEEMECFSLQEDRCPNANITFWMYTNGHPRGFEISQNNIPRHEFEPQKRLKVLIHGFNGNRDFTPNAQLRSKFTDLDINVISVEYKKLAREPCYSEAVDNAKIVGKCLAALLWELLENELVRNEDLHLIGFGLGAHVAGFTGSEVPYKKLEHITALDPAKPLFLGLDAARKLDPTDANFVDVLHTDVLMHGLLDPQGHVDFYINMGLTQPNCGPISKMETHLCYHNRSADYYAESISTAEGFIGFFCPNFKSFATGDCKPTNNIELMGYYVRSEARGRYFLGTNKVPPYAMGLNYENLDRQVKGRTFLNDELMETIFKKKSS
ncbi:inactive pancreatic lipase-related protein 1 [Drosophila ficusphila]|uniref:inactive pancreatic lipase-related protein 1 n=1 Tax=Drosophila ficusphila TaxID=30025 RepID=UPI0007E79F89|nr:inactive pancreatic lipase-related protein 1 [Drosophila ficusphila]